jgi:formylglycine-generating enzyme required for sulfatase activity
MTATKGMVLVSGGQFRMGSGDFYPEERPIHEVVVGDLWVDEHPVTNAQFRRFVKAQWLSGYPTRRIFLVRQRLIWCPGL